jgi:glycine/D-amino acid oxidase-like deaminating enzyme
MTRPGPRVVVAGAGAFGGWTALELARRGAAVTLIDAWGPGNARASSGGDTRLIRATYGTRHVYTAMALRALDRWREYDAAWGQRLLNETGVLWLFEAGSAAVAFARASTASLREHGATLVEHPLADARRRYPQIAFDGIDSVYVEPAAGYLMARRACHHVTRRVVAEGGRYVMAAARTPVTILDGPLEQLDLQDGSALEADAFVFACGPWLASLFPDVLGRHLTVTRQEVHYFGAPAGEVRFTDAALPAWVAFGDRQVYGVPGSGRRGFKIADDSPGPAFDPTTGDRAPGAAAVAAARAYLTRRFPGLASAPLVGAEVCQYESSPDADYIIDRHPRAGNVWLVGGGSGHGFKMGPVIGELAASRVLGESAPDPRFSLARLAEPPPSGWLFLVM